MNYPNNRQFYNNIVENMKKTNKKINKKTTSLNNNKNM
jgi:hypothetical protein